MLVFFYLYLLNDYLILENTEIKKNAINLSFSRSVYSEMFLVIFVAKIVIEKGAPTHVI